MTTITPLTDYVGTTAHGMVFCTGHKHDVKVRITEVVGDKLKVETDGVWCEADQGIDDTAWVVPLWDDEPVGGSPLVGETEDEAHEIQLDMD